MKRATRRRVSLLGVVVAAVLLWPGPAGASTTLVGYTGSAVAEPVRVEIFEPVLPIPSSPQIDGGVAYTSATTSTGPVSRALASYLWPGTVVGDGFGTLIGNDAAKYPVQVNSENPPTKAAPATNSAQLTDGNGMATSSNSSDTHASASGLGIAGPGTNLLSGVGSGLGQLLGSAPSGSSVPAVPVPVSSALAALATVGAVKSTSDVLVGAKTVTATAHATTAGISLLGGVVTIGAVDITSASVSNGTTSSNSAVVHVAGITIAGRSLGLDEKGLDLAGKAVRLPTVPASAALAQLGISVQATQIQQTRSGATASFGAQGLTISIDTVPLKTLLNTSSLTDPIAAALSKIPNIGSELAPLLNLGPKIVIQLGNVTTAATASPAYAGGAAVGAAPVGGTTRSSSPGVRTGGATVGGAGVTGGGGAITSSNGGGGGGVQAPTVQTAITPTASTGLDLPPLGAVPKALILGGTALALAFGWLLRNAGAMLFGAGTGCDHGLDSGVPDLRKVR